MTKYIRDVKIPKTWLFWLASPQVVARGNLEYHSSDMNQRPNFSLRQRFDTLSNRGSFY
jgi:hypothetical protein